MRKIYIIGIIILIVILILFRKSNDKTIKYKIKNGNDVYNIVEKHNGNYTYYEISWNKNVYPINIFNKNKDKRQINQLYSFTDNTYYCVLPLFKGKVLTDIMCYKDGTIYNYQSIKDGREKLNSYVSKIKEYENFNKYEDNEEKCNNVITINNTINKKISITTYKGLIVDNKEIKLFDKDVYSNKISTYIDKYYVTADYNANYEFDKFYIVDLTSKDVSTLKTKEPISFDSYIQGIVDNKIYLYDPENEIQYEIDPKNKKIKVTSSDTIKYYSNNKWTKVSVKQAKELYFDYSSLNNIYNEYDKVYENDYYYYAIKNDNLYRINKNNTETREFLTKVPVDEIIVNKDYAYYAFKNSLYYYNNLTDLRVVLTDSELEFNKYIKYYIY